MDTKSPPDSSKIVVIGAGIVGCSTAYHLAERGRSDVAVVDQGEIPVTGGSTVHAPGGLVQGSANETLTRLARRSHDLYQGLDGLWETGNLDLATDREELEYLTLLRDHCHAYGIDDARLLSPSEIQDHAPLMDVSSLVGGLYIPSDGRLKTTQLLDTLRRRAENGGVSFHERTTVTDIEVKDGSVQAVVTRRPGFRRDEEAVLAVDVAHIDQVTPLARQARQLSAYPVGDLACFNVDFSREFRYRSSVV